MTLHALQIIWIWVQHVPDILPPPSIGVNTTWCFNLNLLGSIWPFLNHRGDLGFDPTGRTLFIGTHNHDNIFLAIAPWTFVEASILIWVKDLTSTEPLWIGCRLTLHYLQYSLVDADQDNSSKQSFKAMLNLPDVCSMHDTMQLYESHFFTNAPKEWHDDPWFEESVPLIVLMNALPVAKMQNIDPATILEAHDMIFDENEQEIMDLASLPYEERDQDI
ncbi:uncharacterized protein EI90DRAFT_3175163 [Cantharellus anzutake]|uniref:uncharacterized protein n=1 Tax=Cantharellus anzutake TaxID=1750568 RepID=UPI001908F12D|nr:uncharacterized protein EI90DRAFT_3175163 [Cantharellus anzutake]KAF8315299.1 hypothetical protein EI90DRAFT_3175163 [Cantharellus anzutake]